MPNGEGHRILTVAAIDSLPSWEQDIVAAVREELEQKHCMNGDDYYGNTKELGPYVELPDGSLPMDPWEIRHFRKDAPGKDYYTCGYYDLMRQSFTHFARKCVDSLQNGNLQDFALFAGTIAHVIEDCGCPPHAVGTNMGTDMKMLKLLFPANDPRIMARQFHTILEGKYNSFSLNSFPNLLGVSPEEISFNMIERFTDMLEVSIRQIPSMLEAYYNDDESALANHLTTSGKFSSEVLADFIHSVICVAYQKYDKHELETLDKALLSEYTPKERSAWAPSPYHYAEIRKSAHALDREFNPIPLELLVDGSEKTYSSGFGLGPPYSIMYELPVGVYRQFSCDVGIHRRLGASIGIRFRIMGDDIELATLSCPKIDNSSTLTVDISNVKTLTLLTETMEVSDHWPNNTHAVWGTPTLHK